MRTPSTPTRDLAHGCLGWGCEVRAFFPVLPPRHGSNRLGRVKTIPRTLKCAGRVRLAPSGRLAKSDRVANVYTHKLFRDGQSLLWNGRGEGNDLCTYFRDAAAATGVGLSCVMVVRLQVLERDFFFPTSASFSIQPSHPQAIYRDERTVRFWWWCGDGASFDCTRRRRNTNWTPQHRCDVPTRSMWEGEVKNCKNQRLKLGKNELKKLMPRFSN